MSALKIVLIIVSVLDLFSQNGNKSKSHKFNYYDVLGDHLKCNLV